MLNARPAAVTPKPLRSCPQCGSPMTLGQGVIEEPRIASNMRIVRAARPATFWSCWSCEHCEEVSRG